MLARLVRLQVTDWLLSNAPFMSLQMSENNLICSVGISVLDHRPVGPFSTFEDVTLSVTGYQVHCKTLLL